MGFVITTYCFKKYKINASINFILDEISGGVYDRSPFFILSEIVNLKICLFTKYMKLISK